jgi:hypothetical protein
MMKTRSKTLLFVMMVELFFFTARPAHVFAHPADSASQGAVAAQKPSTSAAVSADAQDSVVEAARKARAQKDKASKPGRMVTDEDLHNLKGTVSVVGAAPSASNKSAKPAELTDKPAETTATTEQKGPATAEQGGQKDQNDQNDQNGSQNDQTKQNGDQNEQNGQNGQNGNQGGQNGGQGAQNGGQYGGQGGGDN